jgi:hypothetical protein
MADPRETKELLKSRYRDGSTGNGGEDRMEIISKMDQLRKNKRKMIRGE